MKKNESINNDTVANALKEITTSISNYQKAISDIDNDINAEKSKHDSLKNQIDGYSDLDDEKGYLSLKQALRASEDRLEFLQKKRKAIAKVDESTLNADRSKFWHMQNDAIISAKERLIPILDELYNVNKEIDVMFKSINQASESWTMTFGQTSRPLQDKFDPSGLLVFVSQFCINYENRKKLIH